MSVDLAEFKLTKKQEQWVLHYPVSGFNGFKAAQLAGYRGSDATLRSIASENLTKPNIKAALEVVYRATLISSDEVINRLGEMARGEVPTRVTENKKQGDTITYDAGKALTSLIPSRLELTGKDGGPIDIDYGTHIDDYLTQKLLQPAPVEDKKKAVRGDDE